MNNRDFFNLAAAKWDESVYHDKDKLEYIFDFIGTKERAKILDVGCGTGALFPYILRFFPNSEITAVDIAENMLEIAKKKFTDERIKFINGDALTLTGYDGYFDYILCYSTFPHLDKALATIKFADMLSCGGALAIFHSQSRKAINSLHKGMNLDCSPYLPDAETVKDYLSCVGIDKIKIIDNEEMYVITGVKVRGRFDNLR
ncbi:MAG: class I SAM-dependent methyltransferase [Christensenellales bacterium]|jgi:2-polyprenyl-3-methyl-5-hydroxy-6-metoxy-1,4-benzoquinol methylase